MWYQKFWHPINSAGFRDHEWTNLDSSNLIAVVGDSFVAGTGIDDVADRFSDKSAELLGAPWQSVTLAKGGWGPKEEIKALNNFQYHSSAIVLSYFINDIEDVMPACGRSVYGCPSQSIFHLQPN